MRRNARFPSIPTKLAVSFLSLSLIWPSTLHAEPLVENGYFPFYHEGRELAGSDEAFQPSLYKGSFKHRVPIQSPPGIAGISPNLSLVYDSNAKTGSAGKGWDFNLPKVVRSSREGADKTQSWNPLDAKYLYNGQQIRSCGKTMTDPFGKECAVFAPEVETFERILYCPENDYWTVLQKNGTFMTFGRNTALCRSKLVLPQADAKTFEYYLDEVRTANNLSWMAFYSPVETTMDGKLIVIPPVLQYILYTYEKNNPWDDGALQTTGDTRKIAVEWEFRNPQNPLEPESINYHYGFPLVYNKRIKNIRVSIGERKVRRYQLSYDAHPGLAGEQFSPDTGASILHTITEYGSDDTASLPSLNFHYKFNVGFSADKRGFSSTPKNRWFPNAFGLDYAKSFLAADGWGASWIVGQIGFQKLIDMNGDGMKDVLTTCLNPQTPGYDWSLHKAEATGASPSLGTAPVSWSGTESAPMRLEELVEDGTRETDREYNRLIDLNGDGLPDFIYRKKGTIKFFYVRLNNGSGFGAPKRIGIEDADFWRIRETKRTFGTAYFDTKTKWDMVDVNGDNRPDILYVNEAGDWYWNRNKGSGSFEWRKKWKWDGKLDCLERVMQYTYGYGTPPFGPEAGIYFGAPAYYNSLWLVAKEYNFRTPVQLVDINNDGLIDLFFNSKIYDSLDDLLSPARNVPRVLMGTGAGFLEAPCETYSADLQAIFEAQDVFDGEFAYLTVDYTHSDDRYGQFHGQSVGLFDMNGDGFKDLVIPNRCRVDNVHRGADVVSWKVFLNNGRGFARSSLTWSLPTANFGKDVIQETVPAYRFQDILNAYSANSMLADWSGSGSPDVVHFKVTRYPAALTNYSIPYRYAEQRAGLTVGEDPGEGALEIFENKMTGKPDLLTQIDVGMDKSVNILYTTHQKQDSRYIEGVHKMSTPATVVSSVRVSDKITGSVYTNDYFYSQGYHRGTFNGFGRVVVNRFDNLGTEPRWEEHLFANGDPARTLTDSFTGQNFGDGAPFRGKRFAVKAGPAYKNYEQESWTIWKEKASLLSTSAAKRVDLETVRKYDIHGAERRWRETKYDYDSLYGNVEKVTEYGEVARTPSGTINYAYRNDEFAVKVWHAKNPGRHVVNTPSKTCVYADVACNNLLSRQDFHYDNLPWGQVERGNLTTQSEHVIYKGVDEETADTHITYDSRGNTISVTDASGGKTDITYWPDEAYVKSASTIVQQGKPAGQFTVLSSQSWWDDRYGVKSGQIDANGRYIKNVYDVFGRLTEVYSSKPEVSVTEHTIPQDLVLMNKYLHSLRYTNTPGGKHVVATDYFDVDGHAVVTTTFLDSFGRPIQTRRLCDYTPTESPPYTYSQISRRFNYQGLAAETTPPCAQKTASSAPAHYEPFDFNAAIPAAPVQKHWYGWDGREKRRALVYAQNGQAAENYAVKTTRGLWEETVENESSYVPGKKKYRRDVFGRLVSIQEIEKPDAVKGAVTYHYDDLGNLTSYQDQGANTTSLAYDSRGMLRAISDPDLCNRPDHRSRTFSYDKNGRLLSALDSKDQTVHLTRDELGRVINRQLLSKESLELESDVFEYDDGPGAAGNLSRYQNVTNALFSRLDRDYWGRPLTETKAFGEEEYKTETVFDLLGRPTKITYPSGETVNYAYHPAVGLTDRITWRDPANSWDNIILHEIKYDPVFRPVFYGIGSGFVYRGYDPAFQKLRMQEIHTKTASLKFEYRYYPDGNMERGGDIAGNVGWKYAYDYAGRLGAAKKEEGGNLLFAADYSYEPNGNIQSFTRRTSADPAPKTFHYGYGIGAGPHAVTGISGATAKTLNYDENGMVVKGPDGETYKYDGEGRLSGVMKDKCNIGFTFDAFGGRAVRNVRCVETAQTLYVGPHYEVTKESGVVHRERYVLLNGKRMVYLTDKNPGKFFHLVDSPLGTPHVVVDGSQFTGTDMFITRDYEPFGTLNESSGIDPGLRYGFTGQEEDPTTGLLHLGAREYAPPLMRMIQPDPIVPNLANPQSLNRYSYAYNNPARYTDVSGYSPEDRDFLSWDAPSDQFWENFDDRYDPPLPPLVTIPSRIPLKSADGLAAKSPGKHPAIDAITFESVPGPYKSDGFDTAEKAAVAAINEVNPRSIAQNREFGGCVYFDSSTNLFYYTEALMGDADSTYVGTIPNGMEHAGYYHTHAGPTGLAWQFSPADQKIARGMKTSVSPKGVPIYVGTPTGVIFVYTPNGKGSTESDFKKIQWPNNGAGDWGGHSTPPRE